jgi:ATP-binding cassette subfamily B protein
LIGCSVILVVFVGGAQVGAGKLSAGAIAAFLMFTNMLMWPVSSLGWTASMIQRAIASQKRINQFLNYEPAVQHVAGIEKKMEGEIVFDHVSFTYPDTGIVALKNVSFKVNPGQRLAIIGRTGSGKSTIADLIMRMYDVSSGKITVDGSNIKEWNLASLRRQVGFVPQDVFLFSETITDNISFGLNESDKNLAVKSAQYASIRSEIENFPEGFETIVGERGVTLSGGQKQRISIARALSKPPKKKFSKTWMKCFQAKPPLLSPTVFFHLSTSIILLYWMKARWLSMERTMNCCAAVDFMPTFTKSNFSNKGKKWRSKCVGES